MKFYKLKKEHNGQYFCDKEAIKEEMIALADPSYDLTFKNIFSNPKPIGLVTWEKRTISLFNSLFFKEKIEKITLLNNEHINATLKIKEEEEDEEKNERYKAKTNNNNLSLLKSDLVFKIKFEGDENVENVVNVEMQVGLPGSDFLSRLMHYGTTIRKEHKKKKTMVIGFLNNPSQSYHTSSFALSEFDMKDNKFLRKVNDFIEVIILNLKEISEKLIKNEEIYIAGRNIDDTGKNWLKLLSLRHWSIKNDKFYKIPKLRINTEIESAISYLQTLTNNSIDAFYELEDNYYDNLNDYAEEMVKEKTAELKEKIQTLEKNQEDEKLKAVLNTYKTFKVNLDEMERACNIDLSQYNLNKIELFWGNDEQEKLKELKEFIGRKRKKNENENRYDKKDI